jgi:hypothetical protein
MILLEFDMESKNTREILFERIQESLIKYPSLDMIIKRIEKIEDIMDSKQGHWDDNEETFKKLMDEWGELNFSYDLLNDKLKTFDEWKKKGKHVIKGEKSKIKLNGVPVFHSTQTERNGCKESRIPRNRYNKWESPDCDEFARQMDHDLGGIEYYQGAGFWG